MYGGNEPNHFQLDADGDAWFSQLNFFTEPPEINGTVTYVIKVSGWMSFQQSSNKWQQQVVDSNNKKEKVERFLEFSESGIKVFGHPEKVKLGCRKLIG
jgi:hypothetical protein